MLAQIPDLRLARDGQVLGAARAWRRTTSGALGQYHSEFGEQPPDTVDDRRSLNDKPLATRCKANSACCSALFTGTKRMFGRPIASQIASASLPSFLPLFRRERRTSAPSASPRARIAKRRAHSWAPAQASMPMRQGGSRGYRLHQPLAAHRAAKHRLPAASTPCSENTRFARSIPTVVICSMTSPPDLD